MMSNLKRILAVLLSLLLVMTFVPAKAVEAAPEFDKTENVILYQKGQEYGIAVRNLAANQTIKKATVKSSKKAVATIYRMNREFNRNIEKNYEDKISNNYTSYSYMIYIKVKKAGKTVISFKVGNKKYKINVVVKKAVNPFKTLKITNVNKSKNIASKFKKSNVINFKGVSSKNSVLSYKLKAGWKITDLYVNCIYPKYSENIYQHSIWGPNGQNKGISAKKIAMGALKKEGTYEININVENKSGLRERFVIGISDSSTIVSSY